MEWREMIRALAVSVVIAVALGGCIGHDDPVGIARPPRDQDDGDVRELSPPVRPPLPRPVLSDRNTSLDGGVSAMASTKGIT